MYYRFRRFIRNRVLGPVHRLLGNKFAAGDFLEHTVSDKLRVQANTMEPKLIKADEFELIKHLITIRSGLMVDNLQEVGQGTFGAVYMGIGKVLDNDGNWVPTGDRFAIKCMSADYLTPMRHELWRRRVMREVYYLHNVSHPNTVQIFDYMFLPSPESPLAHILIKMEYLEFSMQQLVDQEGQLSVEETAHIGRQLGSALVYLHSRGMVHHDVKMGNVMLDRYDRSARSKEDKYRAVINATVKLVDFGLVTEYPPEDPRAVRDTRYVGSSLYMCPKKFSKKPYCPALSESVAFATTCTLALLGVNNTMRLFNRFGQIMMLTCTYTAYQLEGQLERHPGDPHLRNVIDMLKTLESLLHDEEDKRKLISEVIINFNEW